MDVGSQDDPLHCLAHFSRSAEKQEHHSNLVPWQLLAEKTGAKLKFGRLRSNGTLAPRSKKLLVAPGIATRSDRTLLGTKGIASPFLPLHLKALLSCLSSFDHSFLSLKPTEDVEHFESLITEKSLGLETL